MNGLPEVLLTVMIPSYLEADSLRDLLPRIKAAAEALTPACEVLVGLTRSSLSTTPAAVCAANAVRHVYRHPAATITGTRSAPEFREAQGTYLLCMDADGSHNPQGILRVCGTSARCGTSPSASRYAKGGQTENPKHLIFMSWVVNFTFRVSFNIKAKDVDQLIPALQPCDSAAPQARVECLRRARGVG